MVKQANHRGTPARPPCRQAQRSEAKPASRVHVRRTEPSARTARILAAIEAGMTALAIARRFRCTTFNVWAIARRWGRVVVASRRGKPRSGVAVTARGRAAMRQYERAHGLPAAVGA